MVGSVVAGYYLDNALKTFPWLSGVFFLAGLAAGVKTAIFIVKKYKNIF